jgi:hypothetical protein
MNGFIELITGTLGGGKSALAVERAFSHSLNGGFVYTNIECYREEWAKRVAERGLKFDQSRLVMLEGDSRDFYKVVKRGTAEMPVMLVIDEAGLDLDSRDFAKTSKELIAFNTMARKLDIWLVYISQSMNDVDKKIRGKADTVWVCRNMKKLTIWGIIPMPLPFYFRVRFDTTRGGKLVKMDSDFTLHPSSWGLYNSDAMVGNEASKFRGMEKAEGGPLEKLERKQSGWRSLVSVETAVAFGTCAGSLLFS